MTRIKRLEVKAAKDNKDLKIEELEKENLHLKQFIIDLQRSSKTIIDENDQLSQDVSKLNDEADELQERLDLAVEP